MDILSLAIVGIIVSILVKYLKTRTDIGEYKTLGIVALLSVIAAIGYYFFSQNEALWKIIFQILTVAGAFYAFVIERFKAPENPII